MPSKIYLCNLDIAVTDEQLKEHFSSYGEITDIQLPADKKTKLRKGYGFITFAADDSAEKALAEDGKTVFGTEITVQIAIEKPRKK